MTEERQAYEKAVQADTKASIALSRIDEHEKVCAERYTGIYKKLDQILMHQWSMARGLIAVLLTVLGTLIAKVLGWI